MEQWQLSQLERLSNEAERRVTAAQYKHGTDPAHLLYLQGQADSAYKAYQKAWQEYIQQMEQAAKK